MTQPSSLQVSVVVPIFNEIEILEELCDRTLAVLNGLSGGDRNSTGTHEIVFVDDGSTDGSGELLEAFAGKDPRVQVLRLSRNFGHQTALTAGLDHARGDAIYVMDGDLQDPPEELPRFLEAMGKGFDVVYGVRVKRKENIALRAAYFLSYRLIAWFSKTRLPLDSGDHALISRRVLNAMKAMPEHHRYLRGLRSWVGFRQAPLPIERAPRAGGETKYSLFRLVGLALDGLLAFSTAPLRAATLFGVTAITLSLIYTSYAVFARIVWNESPQGFTTLLIAVVFLGGIQMLLVGVLGEYVGRIYEEVKGRPHYVVGKTVGSRAKADSNGPMQQDEHL